MPINTVRILLLGDSMVGKTSLATQYVDRAFNSNTLSTIGIDYMASTVAIEDKRVKIQIWDTAGQERFNSFTSPFYRSAHGVMFVYDMTKPASFENISVWLANFRKNAEKEDRWTIPKVLVANKLDLSAQRSISHTYGKVLADTHSMLYFETSAKTNVNVSEAFTALIKLVLEQIPYEAAPTERLSLAAGDESSTTERRSRYQHSRFHRAVASILPHSCLDLSVQESIDLTPDPSAENIREETDVEHDFVIVHLNRRSY